MKKCASTKTLILNTNNETKTEQILLQNHHCLCRVAICSTCKVLHHLYMTAFHTHKSYSLERLKWSTHSVLEEMETAESKRTDPKGPTFAFSTRTPCLVRSSLMASL
jgi:hypothetical protein